ncbi:MAG: hypothetical protein AAFO94_03245 [Bacteroidota bacterium]
MEKKNFKEMLQLGTGLLLVFAVLNLRLMMLGPVTLWHIFEFVLDVGLMVAMAFVWNMHQQQK